MEKSRRKLRKYQCFCSVLSKKHCKYRGFCYQKIPEAKNIVNTAVLGFRGAKNIGIYGVFFARRVSKKRENTTYLTYSVATRLRKKRRGNNNNNDDNNDNNNNNNNDDNDSTVVFGLWGAKNMEFCGVFCPEENWLNLTQTKWPLVGPCAHHRHHQQRNDSKHLSLDSFASLFFAILLCRRILHRYASTNRRRYAQKPLHRAAFMRRYSYTERFVHR